MAANGLATFSLHRTDAAQRPTVVALDREINRADDARLVSFEPQHLDPETVARRYLDGMIASAEVPEVAAAPPTEYGLIGTESVPLTGTTVVRFAQYRHRVPVYGSLVTVELDEDHTLLSVNSAVGDPSGVDPVASLSPAQVLEIARSDAADTTTLSDVPRLFYFYDDRTDPVRWRLVYILTDVTRETSETVLPDVVDYVIDAHTGELVARPARTQNLDWTPDEVQATDGLGNPRRLRVERDTAGNRRLHDPVRNVRTCDFDFRDVLLPQNLLPGDVVVHPPEPWERGAVSAHANAVEVAEFYFTTLRRDGIDGKGGTLVSTVRCTMSPKPPEPREWRNAAWVGGSIQQMIYGQRLVDGALRSYAISLDVVGHEITHGVINSTARLVYETESGALNESYADIFGIIVANAHRKHVDDWDWEMGEGLTASGLPLRDLSDPERRGQPAHLDDYQHLPLDNDHGGVHTNSGIHNKAAHLLLTAKRPDGTAVFTMVEAASLFYLALTLHLSRRSGFADSRRGVELAARSLFRREPADALAARLAAIGAAFDGVGVLG